MGVASGGTGPPRDFAVIATTVPAALAWVGARARWVLAVGVIVAAFLPALSEALRPALPALVSLVFCIAMVRMDLGSLARQALAPRRLARTLLLSLGLLVLTPTLFWAAAVGVGASPGVVASLVYTGAAPPITSAAGLCLLLGLNAALALELTVVASLATPLVGPLVTKALLGEAVPIDALELGLRVGAMIVAGAMAAILLRRVVGPARIAAKAKMFDGIGALAMLLFVIPLFDGVLGAILDHPLFALGIFALTILANFGVQVATVLLARARTAPETAGALGLVSGNRTVAIYLAALPPDPLFGLYVALYQIPMLFTPLVMGPLLRGRLPR